MGFLGGGGAGVLFLINTDIIIRVIVYYCAMCHFLLGWYFLLCFQPDNICAFTSSVKTSRVKHPTETFSHAGKKKLFHERLDDDDDGAELGQRARHR